MEEIISLGITFATIFIFYFVAQRLLAYGAKKMTEYDIKPYVKKYCTPLFLIMWTGSLIYIALFNFPGFNTGTGVVVPTAETPYEVTVAPVVTNTMETKVDEVSKDAKEDANKALSEARSLFGK